MTEREIIKMSGITVKTFDSELLPDELGFFISEINTAFLSDKLTKKERIKVLLHELGHKEHTPSQYQLARIRCENEADRCMIHHLIKDAVASLDDVREFNYLNFMDYYNLKTMTDEIMVKEEFNSLLAGL